jgi:hypothetical protein
MKRIGKYIILDVERRIKEVYDRWGSEAAYSTYRAITGATVKESWRVCKPLIKKWEGIK